MSQEDDPGNYVNDELSFPPPPAAPYRTPSYVQPVHTVLQFADGYEQQWWREAVKEFTTAHAQGKGAGAFNQAVKDADAFILAWRARIETLRTKK